MNAWAVSRVLRRSFCSAGIEGPVSRILVAIAVSVSAVGARNARGCVGRLLMPVRLECVGFVSTKGNRICSDTAALNVDARLVGCVLRRSFRRASCEGWLVLSSAPAGLRHPRPRSTPIDRLIHRVGVALERVSLVGTQGDRICSDTLASDVDAGFVGGVKWAGFTATVGKRRTIELDICSGPGGQSRRSNIGNQESGAGCSGMRMAFNRSKLLAAERSGICSDTATLDMNPRLVGRLLGRGLRGAIASRRHIGIRGLDASSLAIGEAGSARLPVNIVVIVALDRVGLVGTEGDRICSDTSGLDVDARLVGRVLRRGFDTSPRHTRQVKAEVSVNPLTAANRDIGVRRSSELKSTGGCDCARLADEVKCIACSVLHGVGFVLAERDRICSDTATRSDMDARLIGRVLRCRLGGSGAFRCIDGAIARVLTGATGDTIGSAMAAITVSVRPERVAFVGAERYRICSDTAGASHMNAWLEGRVLGRRLHPDSRAAVGAVSNRLRCSVGCDARGRVGVKACSEAAAGLPSVGIKEAVPVALKGVSLVGAERYRICSDTVGLDVDARLVGCVLRRSLSRAGCTCDVIGVRELRRATGGTALDGCPIGPVGVRLEGVGFVRAKRHRICSDMAGLDMDARLIGGVLWRGLHADTRRPVGAIADDSPHDIRRRAQSIETGVTDIKVIVRACTGLLESRPIAEVVRVPLAGIGFVRTEGDRICSDTASRSDMNARLVGRLLRGGFGCAGALRRVRDARRPESAIGATGTGLQVSTATNRMRVRFDGVDFVGAESDRICSEIF